VLESLTADGDVPVKIGGGTRHEFVSQQRLRDRSMRQWHKGTFYF